MNIYLAARYSRRLELVAYKNDLEALGHTVTSRWLLGTHESAIPDDALHLPEHRYLAAGYALEDIVDVRAAELLIAFTEAPLPFASRGGRHVEFGLALAWGIRLCICGPLENVFYTLPKIEHFSTWEACLLRLAKEKGNYATL